MQSTTTTVVISKLQRIFAGHGYPEEVITDNGPPFNAVEFTEYLAAHGVHHRRITPYWPQANGEAERFMKTVTKAIRTAHSEGKRWQSELDLFLLNYRSTPHSTTHISPAELLFNRSFRNKLPSFSSLQHNDGPVEHHVVRDKEEKEKMKVHADRRNNAKESQLKVGDHVLMQVPKDNKLSMPFNPKPFKVIEIKGNMVTARNTERTVTRNVSCFKCLTNYKNASEEDQNNEEDDFHDGIVENQQPTIVEEQQQDLPDLQRRYQKETTLVTVLLQASQIDVTEASTNAIVLVTVNGAREREISVNVSTYDVSAFAVLNDYYAKIEIVTLQPNSLQAPFLVRIREDNIVENTEQFGVQVATTDPQVNVINRNLQVSITDND
ncbi:uncharacterized protein K02A2.6-like, partial [Paramuricea clavata]